MELRLECSGLSWSWLGVGWVASLGGLHPKFLSVEWAGLGLAGVAWS